MSNCRLISALALSVATLSFVGVSVAGQFIIYRATPAVIEKGQIQDGTEASVTNDLALEQIGSTDRLYGESWDLAVRASGGVAPYMIEMSEALPPGISTVNDGASLSFHGGTYDGTFGPFDVTVADAEGNTEAASVTVTVEKASAPLAVGEATTSSHAIAQSQPWDVIVPIAGGLSPYVLTGASGLPAGVDADLVGDGINLSGSSAPGSYGNIALTVRDAASKTASSSSMTVVVDAPLAISSPGQVVNVDGGANWSILLSASGGRQGVDATAAYSFSISPELPASVTFPSQGTSFATSGGAPEGSYGPFVVTATDALGRVVESQSFSVDVGAASGSLYAWGKGSAGALGNDPLTGQSSTPVSVAMPSGVTSFSQPGGGDDFACALGSNSRVYCWGQSPTGQLGFVTGGTSKPTTAINGTYVSLAVGSRHACALTAVGTMHCWGANDEGQIGVGYVTTRMEAAQRVTFPEGVTKFRDMAVGYDVTCAIGDDSALYCWGRNANGAVGVGATPVRLTTPTKVPLATGIATYSQPAAGGESVCAVGSDKALYCWGSIGNVKSPKKMVFPSGVTAFTKPSMSISAACATGNDAQGSLHCIGNYPGNGATGASVFVKVTVPAGATAPFTGIKSGSSRNFLCAQDAASKAWCWGLGSNGNLGNGSFGSSTVPVAVLATPNFSAIGVGAYNGYGIR